MEVAGLKRQHLLARPGDAANQANTDRGIGKAAMAVSSNHKTAAPCGVITLCQALNYHYFHFFCGFLKQCKEDIIISILQQGKVRFIKVKQVTQIHTPGWDRIRLWHIIPKVMTSVLLDRAKGPSSQKRTDDFTHEIFRRHHWWRKQGAGATNLWEQNPRTKLNYLQESALRKSKG